MLVYTVGNADNKNSSQCILDIALVDQDGETYILSMVFIVSLSSKTEEQRLKNLC